MKSYDVGVAGGGELVEGPYEVETFEDFSVVVHLCSSSTSSRCAAHHPRGGRGDRAGALFATSIPTYPRHAMCCCLISTTTGSTS